MTDIPTSATPAIAALRVDIDATITHLTDVTHQTLHDAIGGDLEPVPGDGTYTIWVNENGKVLDLPRNPLGEGLWYLIDDAGCLAAGDWMAGPCVITGPLDDHGDVLPVGDDVVDAVHLIAAAATVRRPPGPDHRRPHQLAVMSRRHPRLSIGPLEAWLNARYTNTDPSADRQLDGRLAARRIGELVGVDRVVVQRWRADGVPLYAADRAAIYAGTHPIVIWPDFHTITSEAPVTITFHIDHHNDDEHLALDAEAAPTLNVHLAGAAQLLHTLGIALVALRRDRRQRTPRPPRHRRHPRRRPVACPRLRTLRAVAGAALRVGRDIAWD